MGEEKIKLGFENLAVWNKAIDFAVMVIDAIENSKSGRKHFRLLEQMESASSSISMNIAEGKGRFSKKEFVQYLYIARGSLYETMSLLEIFKRKKWIEGDQHAEMQRHAVEIASMIKGLINSILKK